MPQRATPHRSTLALALLTLLGAQGAGHAASGPTDNMIYVPVDQCRLVDTRNSTGGNLVANVPQSFDAYGPAADIAAQGGTATGCLDPKLGGPVPVAAMLNVFAVGKSAASAGIVRAYAVDSTAAKTYSLVPFEPGIHSANGAIIPLCRGTCTGNKEFTLFSNANVPVAVDVIGYFYPKDSNVVTVARDGGDFLSPLDAMDYLRGLVAAGDPNAPSAANPWVIQVSPGTYDLPSTLTLDVPDVTVRGAGKSATTLVGSADAARVAITRGNVNLESLAVVSLQGVGSPPADTGDAISISAGLDARAVLRDVDATAPETNFRTVTFSSGVVLWDGGTISGAGVVTLALPSADPNNQPFLELDNVVVRTQAPRATAVSLVSANLFLRNTYLLSESGNALSTGSPGVGAAIVNASDSVISTDVGLTAITDSSPAGQPANFRILQSQIRGPVVYGQSAMQIAGSEVDSPPTGSGTGFVTCVASYNSSFAPLDSTCN